jgi:hypothetical protein
VGPDAQASHACTHEDVASSTSALITNQRISGRLAGHRWQRNFERIKAPVFLPKITSKVIHLLDFGAMSN